MERRGELVRVLVSVSRLLMPATSSDPRVAFGSDSPKPKHRSSIWDYGVPEVPAGLRLDHDKRRMADLLRPLWFSGV